MMKLILVRHGEASASWEESSDPGLSNLGVTQALECADTLFKFEDIENFDLKSSPLKRAIETAEKLKTKLNKHLSIDPAFAEIPSPGVSFKNRQKWLKEIFNKNIDELENPQKNWRDKIISEIKKIEKPTIIFSHFMVINTIVAHIENNPSMVCFYPDNCSITELNKKGNKFDLLRLGNQLSSIIN